MKRRLMLTCLLLGVAGSADAALGLRGSMIANGGLSSTPASNGSFSVYGTAGQPAVGTGQNGSAIVCSGFWCFGGSRVVAVDPPGVAQEFALGPATPTPTRDWARFHLSLPRASSVTLSVYDVAGRPVGDAITRALAAGKTDLSWRATDAKAGIYFATLALDGVVKAKRTIILIR